MVEGREGQTRYVDNRIGALRIKIGRHGMQFSFDGIPCGCVKQTQHHLRRCTPPYFVVCLLSCDKGWAMQA